MAMSLLADRFSLSHEAGALFAGLVLIGTPHVKQAAAAVKPLTSLFGGMYLASLGLIMSPTFIAEHLPTIGAHVACVFGLKLGVVGLTMRVLGFSWAAALAAGATLAQISEVSLFMVARAQQLGLLSRGAYLMILATTVVLLAFGPLAVHAARWIDRKDFLAVESEPLTLWQRIFPLSRRGLIGSPASSRPRSFSDGRKEPKAARKQARSAV